jgi:hypothetical protein
MAVRFAMFAKKGLSPTEIWIDTLKTGDTNLIPKVSIIGFYQPLRRTKYSISLVTKKKTGPSSVISLRYKPFVVSLGKKLNC